jgi:Putative adhesin
MNRQVTRIILTSALLAGFIAPGTGAADSAGIESRTIAADNGSRQLSESWPIAADARVEISSVRGSLTVSAWDKEQAELTGSLGADSKLEISGDARHLVLHVDGTKHGWFGGNGPSHDSSLILHVPRTVALEVDVVSADATVTGIGGKALHVNGVSGGLTISSGAPEADISSVSGDVEFQTLPQSTTTRAHLQTVSGNIDTKGLGGRVKLETVSGDIKLDSGAIEELETATVSGDAQIHAAPGAHGSMSLQSMSGDIRLRLPESLSAHIEASSFSGGIHTDFGKVQEKDAGPGSSLDAHVGSGDARINAETFSGNIELRRQ